MFKIRKIILIATIIIGAITLYISLLLIRDKLNFIEQNENLKVELYEAILNNKEIDFSNIVDFEWDEVYIILPYDNLEAIFKNDKVEFNSLKRSIGIVDEISLITIREDIALLLFLNNNKIVSYVNYPWQYGDFAIESYLKLDKEEAKFKVVKNTDTVIELYKSHLK